MRQLEDALDLLAGQDPPIDTTEMIDSIEQHLSQGGVPVVAWNGSRTMQIQEKPRQITQRRLSKSVWVFAAALAAAVMAIGIPLWLLGRSSVQDVASTSAEVFDFSQDSMCDWFTAEEMNQIVVAAQQLVGTTMDFGYEWECQPESGRWTASTSEVWLGPLSVAQAMSWAAQPHTTAPDDFVGHERLDESVTYGNLHGSTMWMMEGMNTDLRIEGHENEVLWFWVVADPRDSTHPVDTYYAPLGFALADAMLRDMNWVDEAPPESGSDQTS